MENLLSYFLESLYIKKSTKCVIEFQSFITKLAKVGVGCLKMLQLFIIFLINAFSDGYKKYKSLVVRI